VGQFRLTVAILRRLDAAPAAQEHTACRSNHAGNCAVSRHPGIATRQNALLRGGSPSAFVRPPSNTRTTAWWRRGCARSSRPAAGRSG